MTRVQPKNQRMKLPRSSSPRTHPTGGSVRHRHVDLAEVDLPCLRSLIIPPYRYHHPQCSPGTISCSDLHSQSSLAFSASLFALCSVDLQLWRSELAGGWWLLFWSSTSSSTLSRPSLLARFWTRASTMGTPSVCSHDAARLSGVMVFETLDGFQVFGMMVC